MAILLMGALLLSANQGAADVERSLWDLPGLAESEINLGFWSLMIAKEFDPSVDVPQSMAKLEALAQKVKAGLPDDSDMAKVSIAQIVLYKPGYWNDSRVFTYDFDDPYWEKQENFLLSTILETYKGNCVSLPLLYLTVMEQVDPTLSFSAVRAPLHFFCRFRDRNGEKVFNVEATSGQFTKSDEVFIESLPPDPRALERGYMLKDLTKRELLADLLLVLIEKARKQSNFQQALRYSELALALDDDSVTGLVGKGSTLQTMALEIQQQAKRDGRSMTATEREKAKDLGRQGRALIDQAKAQGWRMVTKTDQDTYLNNIAQ